MTLNATAYPSSPPHQKPRKSRAKRILLLLLGFLLVSSLLIGYLLYRTPSWYQPTHITDPDIDATADAAQLRIVELANQVQNAPVKSFTWSITQNQINSLIAVRVATNRPNTNPSEAPSSDQITDPMVYFSPGKITLAARSTRIPSSDSQGGVGSLAITLETLVPESGTGNNQVRIAVEGLAVNSLPLPRWVIKNQIDKAGPLLVREVRRIMVSNMGNKAEHFMPDIIDWLDHAQRGEPFTPQLKTEGLRPFALKEIRVDQGKLTLRIGPP